MTTEPDRQPIASDGRVLVLDASYTPISVMDWQKAVTLLLAERADAVVESERIISSPSVEILAPSVIKLRYAVPSTRRRISLARRRAVFQIHNWTCCYCGLKAKGAAARDALTIDHVYPTSRGGSKTDPMNQVPACRECNAFKADRTPEEARMKMLFPPREPKWDERFNMAFMNRSGQLPKEWVEFLPAFS